MVWPRFRGLRHLAEGTPRPKLPPPPRQEVQLPGRESELEQGAHRDEGPWALLGRGAHPRLEGYLGCEAEALEALPWLCSGRGQSTAPLSTEQREPLGALWSHLKDSGVWLFVIF